MKEKKGTQKDYNMGLHLVWLL